MANGLYPVKSILLYVDEAGDFCVYPPTGDGFRKCEVAGWRAGDQGMVFLYRVAMDRPGKLSGGTGNKKTRPE